jgi:sortase A
VTARIKTETSWISRLERFGWVAGSALLLAYGGVRADAEIGRRHEVSKFDRVAMPDTKTWSRSRLQAYQASLLHPTGPVLAIVNLPSVALEVPLFIDTSELHLNRGAGVIEHTSAPGAGGNLGIAGHRDGFFRVLERVRTGDTIEVRTQDRVYQYRVTSTSIVSPSDARLLARTEYPVVTLVTCYPFRFVGKAPHRFVVRGVLVNVITDVVEHRLT